MVTKGTVKYNNNTRGVTSRTVYYDLHEPRAIMYNAPVTIVYTINLKPSLYFYRCRCHYIVFIEDGRTRWHSLYKYTSSRATREFRDIYFFIVFHTIMLCADYTVHGHNSTAVVRRTWTQGRRLITIIIRLLGVTDFIVTYKKWGTIFKCTLF